MSMLYSLRGWKIDEAYKFFNFLLFYNVYKEQIVYITFALLPLGDGQTLKIFHFNIYLGLASARMNLTPHK